MKKIFKLVVIFVIIWVSITFYYVTQHSLKGRVVDINEAVHFEEVTVELEKLALYNFERKSTDFESEEFQRKINIVSELPEPIAFTYFRWAHVYSSPYIKDERFYHTTIKGKFIFNQPFEQMKEYYDNIWEYIEIDVVDSVGVVYAKGRGWYYEEEDSFEVHFNIRGEYFPIERLKEGIKVVVTDLNTGEKEEFHIDGKEFKHYEYNDAFHSVEPQRDRH